MAKFKVTGPGGEVYMIDAPDENALNEAVDQMFTNPQAQATPAAPEQFGPQEPFGPQVPSQSSQQPGFRFGAQAVGEGAAGLLGFPVDAATAVAVNPAIWAKNAVFGGDTPLVREPFGGSAQLKKGVRAVADMAGGAVRPDDLALKERMLFEGIGGATGALGGAAGLIRRGADRVTSSVKDNLPKFLDNAAKPYLDDAAKATTRDVAGGFGAGSGVGATQSIAPEYRDMGGGATGVIADIIGSLAGGVGGMGALNFGRGTAQQVKTMVGAPFGQGLAKDVPVASFGERPYSNKSADMASEIYQGSATNADRAPEFMRQNRAELEPILGQRLPTPGSMAEDPGLVALERQMAMEDRNPMIRRDQNLNAALRDTVDTVAPEGADPARLQGAAQAEADRLRAGVQNRNDMQIEVASRGVDKAQGQQRGVEMALQREAAPLAPYQSADAATNASRKLDSAVVDQTYIPDRTQKNALYDAVDPNTPVDTSKVGGAAEAVTKRVDRLPEGFRANAVDQNITAGLKDTPEMPYDVAQQVRMALSDEQAKARASGDLRKVDNTRDIQKPLNEALDAANPEAAANYKDSFAPKYRAGPGDEMAKFTKEVDRDPTRSKTPPEKTAGRFLSGPEKIASLRRVLDDSPAGPQGNAAVRDYLLSDLATSGVLDSKTGVIRPDRLRAWRNNYGSQLDAAPGFGGEVDGMITRAAKGERISDGLAQQIKAAQAKLKETERAAGKSEKNVEDRINKGALGAVLDSDPDKAVSAIMSDGNKSARRLEELVSLTKNDPEARAGLKAAVRDYLVDKSTTTATEKLPAGDSRGPLSFAKTQKIFQEHEAQLANVFSPEEMNSLRVVHKALEVQNLERVRVRSGSDSVEKLMDSNAEKFLATPMGQATEAVIRLKFGMLKGGGIVSIARRYAAGLTPEDGQRAHDLLKRAAFDPDLAMILATRKIKPGMPEYNATIQRALASSAGAQAAIEKDDRRRQ